MQVIQFTMRNEIMVSYQAAKIGNAMVFPFWTVTISEQDQATMR